MTTQDFLDPQRQIDLARDRIRRFESGELAVRDTFAPFKDWTPEAIQDDKRLIETLEAILRRPDGDLHRPL
jgi:hypothetical protein